jgi:hypothetical protein
MPYAGSARLIHHMLDNGAINHCQHLFRDRLGGGQKTRAKTGNRKDGLADRLEHGNNSWVQRHRMIATRHLTPPLNTTI